MSLTIYIVDDDEAVRDSLKILLEAHGYSVVTFESGPAFLTGFDGRQNACVILDIHMPMMSGLEVLRLVRQEWPHLPAIMVTGRPDAAVRREAEDLGVAGLLEKPFRDGILLRTIHDLSSDSCNAGG